MKKITLSAAALLAASTTLYAAAELSVSSTPALPTANYIDNGDFSDAKLRNWSRNSAVANLISLSDGALKIDGDKAKTPNVYCRIRPADVFKAGEPYYISFRAKRSGSLKGVKAGTSLCFDGTNGKRSYVRVPDQPSEDHDWISFSHYDKIPADSKLATYYLCYYNQTGSIWYDDVVMKCGSVDLNISVKGGGLQSITVRNSITGTVLKEKITGSEYNKTLKVPAFGSYSVEVLDRTGEVSSTLYPADEDANAAASDTVIPVTPIKRVFIPKSQSDSFVVATPDLQGKKVYLEFRVFAQRENAGPGGNSNMLKVKVNGKLLGANEVVKPGKTLIMKRSPKKSSSIINRNGFIVYFCNAFMDIPEDNSYCPISFENNNPWDFKLDITNMVESDSLVMIDLQNSNTNAALQMEDLRLVIE